MACASLGSQATAVSEGGAGANIQQIVDERQAARSKRNYVAADKLRGELQVFGVRVNDRDLTWDGPEGMRGIVAGGKGGGKGVASRKANIPQDAYPGKLTAEALDGLKRLSTIAIGAAAVQESPVLTDIAMSELPRPPEKGAESELEDLESQAAVVLKDLKLIFGGADKVPPRMKAAYENLSKRFAPVA